MIRFRTRRQVGLLVAIALSALLLIWHSAMRSSLRSTDVLTGVGLLALVLLLTSLNVRKKVPTAPLGPVAWWMQFHIYGGLFSGVLFLAHAGAGAPSGLIEIWVWALFVLVFLSGLAGLGLSRLLPARLTAGGEEVIYERIPAHRRKLLEEADALATAAAAQSGESVVADFHAHRLRSFLAARPRLLRPLRLGGHRRRALLQELDAQVRSLGKSDSRQMNELARIARVKDDLDLAAASQMLLRLWLFVHIPATYALIIVGAAHGFIALRSGGLS